MKKMIVSLIVITALFAAFIRFQTIASSQTEPPFKFEQILSALIAIKERKKTLQEIINDIKKRGVDFPLTAENDKRLRDEGATNEFIEAIRRTLTINSSGEPTAGMVRKNSIGMELVYIPSGKFMMGSSKEEIEKAFSDCKKQNNQCDPITFGYEFPKHEVIIKNGFWMGRYEVTQGQWQKVMGKNPSSLKECGTNCPVNHVSWENVQDFITELNAKDDNFEYRLPSEAEWEYAARAGTTTAFSFGDSISLSQANFDARNLNGKYVEKATAVGKYSPNAFGLYDMHGNLWEWCQDVYSNYKYTPTDGSADMTGSSGLHVARGGAWDQYNVYVRSATRNPVRLDETQWLTIGFRVVARIKLVEPSK
ncbi:hypothetical protein BH20ACI1_BH20ACI1_08280 [soil metagenome]